ncbi:response regulator transcription factor [Pseudobacter ginsenosidimutans]|jgi:DNA-binding NarL/FixJ family response regulator|uniref:LuxR family two component transcriptional regulator n=1 Tax=Pseudobacter ginsenosidimutans TaxID=661488 RepID=A0A4Q7MTF0_9BACT|nr:response regulator transcription factor [Pseudobacter ginsenosidimutans]QEC41125.1 response regulator transcription factor [Pseudobacter ginsenosidimutans]RZS72115.1 LuxR family two component transcriptional regulator [Pseudobacter ginsenosidimutans]
MTTNITVGLVDDHVLLRNGLAALVKNIGHQVVIEANDGKDFISKLQDGPHPEVVLMDINMPVMDGYETAAYMKQHFPEIKVLALSMYDDEAAIIRMLKNGARGYILKDSDTPELKSAIEAVLTKGFYYTEMITGKLLHTINSSDEEGTTRKVLNLNEREMEFLKLSCSEMTYKEIADKMHLSPRTIDGYRDSLFDKLKIKTRVGLAIYAIKHGIVHV